MLVEEEEGVKSRGAEARGVTEAMKDREGADIAVPYGQRPLSFRKLFLLKLYSVFGWD